MTAALPLEDKAKLEKVAKNIAVLLPFEWTTCDERREMESKIYLSLMNAWKRGYKKAMDEIGL